MNFIIDTETSGSSREDRIISLAIAQYDQLKLSDIRKGLFNPGVSIKEGARWVHNISNIMVKNKPSFRKTNLFVYINDIFSNQNNVIIGHAVENDIYMLAKEGIKCCCPILDTELCTRKVFNTGKSSLKFLRKEFNMDENLLSHFKPHTADGDVMMTYLVLMELLKEKSFEELTDMTMEHVYSRPLPGKRFANKTIDEMIRIDRSLVKEFLFTTTNPSLHYTIQYLLNKKKIKAKML